MGPPIWGLKPPFGLGTLYPPFEEYIGDQPIHCDANNNLKTKNNNSLQWTHKCMKYRHILSYVWNIIPNFCTTFYPTSNKISWSPICISPPIKVKIFAFPSRTKVDSSNLSGGEDPMPFLVKIQVLGCQIVSKCRFEAKKPVIFCFSPKLISFSRL